MSDIAPRLSIGEAAERTGLSVHTLRFYEREGLLAEPIQRDPGGRRVYRQDDVDWITVCVILRASGMPLPAMRRYTEFVRAGGGNETERLTLLQEHRERVVDQMDQLRKCLDLINFKIGVYEDVLDRLPDPSAPTANADHPCPAPSRAETDGPGSPPDGR